MNLATISTNAPTWTSLLVSGQRDDGFHEAVGRHHLALSVTPEYLKQVGLLDNVPPESADIGYLLKQPWTKLRFSRWTADRQHGAGSFLR